MKLEDCYVLGVITKPHGFKGDVVLFVDADSLDDYSQLDNIWIGTDTGMVPFFIDSIRRHADRFVVHLEGVDRESDALKIAGSKVYLPLTELSALNSESFYLHEAPGWQLIDLTTNREVGHILRVLDHAAYPMLEVEAQGKEVLVPLPDHLNVQIDRTAGTLSVALPEGLLDVYLKPDEDGDFDGD